MRRALSSRGYAPLPLAGGVGGGPQGLCRAPPFAGAAPTRPPPQAGEESCAVPRCRETWMPGTIPPLSGLTSERALCRHARPSSPPRCHPGLAPGSRATGTVVAQLPSDRHPGQAWTPAQGRGDNRGTKRADAGGPRSVSQSGGRVSGTDRKKLVDGRPLPTMTGWDRTKSRPPRPPPRGRRRRGRGSR